MSMTVISGILTVDQVIEDWLRRLEDLHKTTIIISSTCLPSIPPVWTMQVHQTPGPKSNTKRPLGRITVPKPIPQPSKVEIEARSSALAIRQGYTQPPAVGPIDPYVLFLGKPCFLLISKSPSASHRLALTSCTMLRNCFPAITGKDTPAMIHGHVLSILFALANSSAPALYGLANSIDGTG